MAYQCSRVIGVLVSMFLLVSSHHTITAPSVLTVTLDDVVCIVAGGHASVGLPATVSLSAATADIILYCLPILQHFFFY